MGLKLKGSTFLHSMHSVGDLGRCTAWGMWVEMEWFFQHSLELFDLCNAVRSNSALLDGAGPDTFCKLFQLDWISEQEPASTAKQNSRRLTYPHQICNCILRYLGARHWSYANALVRYPTGVPR
jgi:hypothetical protein